MFSLLVQKCQSKPFFRAFLMCTFLVFSLPRASDWYRREVTYALLYFSPLLQTFLTTSVYSTFAISIHGLIKIRKPPNVSEPRQNGSVPRMSLIKCDYSNKWVIVAILVFSVVFNASRWAEMEVKTLNITVNGSPSERPYLRSTDLRRNPIYIKWYFAIVSSIVMIFAPVGTLLITCIYCYVTVPSRNHRKKLCRVLLIITAMFVLCHIPKVRSF